MARQESYREQVQTPQRSAVTQSPLARLEPTLPECAEKRIHHSDRRNAGLLSMGPFSLHRRNLWPQARPETPLPCQIHLGEPLVVAASGLRELRGKNTSRGQEGFAAKWPKGRLFEPQPTTRKSRAARAKWPPQWAIRGRLLRTRTRQLRGNQPRSRRPPAIAMRGWNARNYAWVRRSRE
jgi:hypothetical protein